MSRRYGSTPITPRPTTMSRVELIRRKVPEAIAQHEQALRLKPDYAEAHNNLGVALNQAGRVQEAIPHFEQALRLKTDYADAHYNLGNVLLQAGELEEAIGHYKQVLRLKPGDVDAHPQSGTCPGAVGQA